MRLTNLLLVGALGSWSGLAGADQAAPGFVGRDACAPCHAEENARWTGSHHDLAMQEATEASVRGDFGDVTFEHFGVVSRFYRQDGRFMVRTEGADGTPQDFPIRYTIGVYPLQQYLIGFPGGRLQALAIAWDSRPGDQGGQRWFHLHPQEPVRHDDVLHWTGPNLNWNFMCADCHSTHVRKGYDADTGRYQTTWSALDVSCEACHGPGSTHIQWAEATAPGQTPGQAPAMPDRGLTVRLDERAGVVWSSDPQTGKPRRSRPRTTTREIEVCARCHSRRSQLTDAVVAGQPLLDGFQPALLTAGLYHPDGQIQDEVYEWGSLLQSRMYQAGVTCSDCHDPHTGKPRLPGDAVCAQCHPAGRYATRGHHFHAEGSAGASCVACHMPTTEYMVVHARHDHGLRVPRPDQSRTLGTPNACNQCHREQTAEWAAGQVAAWYGQAPAELQRYGPALHAARARSPEAGPQLARIAADAGQPAIARATALQALGAYPDAAMLAQVQQGLAAADPLDRLGALAALESLGPAQRLPAVALLWDELRAVRIEAARLLAGLPADRLPAEVQGPLAEGIREYIAVQAFNAERPEAQLNLGNLYADLGRDADAEGAYRRALERQPRFIPAFVNLAQLLSGRGREPEAEGCLRRGLALNPQSADLEHALGLSLVRQQRPGEATAALARAAGLAPDNPRYPYVYAVALHSDGRLAEAIGVLEDTLRRHPGDLDVLTALATFHRDGGDRQAALRYARELQARLPGDPAADRLVRELAAPRP